jgi:hypothetical protein
VKITTFLHKDKEITERLVNLIVKDMQPFSIVEDQGFRELMSFAFPNYIIPCRETLTKRVEEKYEVKKVLLTFYGVIYYNNIVFKSELLKELQTAEFCSLTTDGWTPKTIPESYVAYTCNYIDPKNGSLKTKVLDAAPFGEESHTGENLEESLRDTVQSWNIEGKTKTSLIMFKNIFI